MIGSPRDHQHATGRVDLAQHLPRSHVQYAKGSGRRDVGDVQETAVAGVAEIEGRGSGLRALGRQDNLPGDRKRRGVRELHHIGAFAVATAREVGGPDRQRIAIRGQRDARKESGIDLAQMAVRVGVVEAHARIDLVHEGGVHDVDPVRRARREGLHAELLGRQRIGSDRPAARQQCQERCPSLQGPHVQLPVSRAPDTRASIVA